MSMKQTEFEGKLRTMEETHRTSLNKLREDVTNQQRSTNQSVLTIDIEVSRLAIGFEIVSIIRLPLCTNTTLSFALRIAIETSISMVYI